MLEAGSKTAIKQAVQVGFLGQSQLESRPSCKVRETFKPLVFK